MSDHLTPADRRRGLAVALAVVVVASVATAVAATWSSPAGAAELDRFTGCGELRRWMGETARRAGERQGVVVGDVLATAGAGEAAPATPEATAARSAAGADAIAGGAATGTTNVGVAGVDELDRVDEVGDERLVVVDEGGTLSLVDVSAHRVLSTLPTSGSGARLTADADAGVVWVLAATFDERSSRVRVTRVRVEGDALIPAGMWETTGRLVDARRVGDRLHVVAVDGGHPTSGGAEPVVPFRGADDRPVVACAEVWHPTAAAGSPEALLVATLDSGAADVRPVATAEVVGGGEIVHATTGALYVATPLWSERGQGDTAIHRFALDGLRWTGSGRVPGRPLNQFALDDFDGVLRVAVTVDRPVPVEPDGGTGAAPEPAADVAVSRAPVDTATDNLVVTLDTEGDLDELGRLSGLGLEAERIHGVRFAGPTAYVVTFRQTDPLYVVDLSDPRRPARRGELKIPGFSSYLHPVGDGLVLGIGRAGDERGTITGGQAQLFDVSDPTDPRRLDAEPLGDDSEAASDHHAVGVLGGGRYALPFTTWPHDLKGPQPLIDEPSRDDSSGDQTVVDLPAVEPSAPDVAPGGAASGSSPGAPGAEPQPSEPALAVVVLRVADRSLERERTIAVTDDRGRNPAAWQGTRTLAVADQLAVVVVGAGVSVHGADGGRVAWIPLPPSDRR